MNKKKKRKKLKTKQKGGKIKFSIAFLNQKFKQK